MAVRIEIIHTHTHILYNIDFGILFENVKEIGNKSVCVYNDLTSHNTWGGAVQ